MTGYSQGQYDHTMFYRHLNGGGVIILIVYADDIIINRSNEVEIQRLKGVYQLSMRLRILGS